MDLEQKHARAKEIISSFQSLPQKEQKRLSEVITDLIECGLDNSILNDDDREIIEEQLEGMRLGIELDF